MKNIWENYDFENVQSKTTLPNMKGKETKQLDNIRERYLQCESWINSHEKDKIRVITENVGYNDSAANLQKTIYWFNQMSKLGDEDKKILFGDVLLTIEDIKDKMLLHLKGNDDLLENEPDEDEDEHYGDYDDSGHASAQGYRNVVNYFETLDEQSLMSIAEGSTMDDYEIDIDGGRSYLMSRSNIYLYIFNYLYYTKKITLKEYEDGICNSGDASDTIGEFYLENFYLPSDDEFEKMYHRKYTEKYQKTFERYNSMVDNILNNFSNEPMLKEMVDVIKGLKADDAYIMAKAREVKIDKIIKYDS